MKVVASPTQINFHYKNLISKTWWWKIPLLLLSGEFPSGIHGYFVFAEGRFVVVRTQTPTPHMCGEDGNRGGQNLTAIRILRAGGSTDDDLLFDGKELCLIPYRPLFLLPTPSPQTYIYNHRLGSAGGKTTPCASLSSRNVQGGSNPPPAERACPSLHPGAGLCYPKRRDAAKAA